MKVITNHTNKANAIQVAHLLLQKRLMVYFQCHTWLVMMRLTRSQSLRENLFRIITYYRKSQVVYHMKFHPPFTSQECFSNQISNNKTTLTSITCRRSHPPIYCSTAKACNWPRIISSSPRIKVIIVVEIKQLQNLIIHRYFKMETLRFQEVVHMEGSQNSRIRSFKNLGMVLTTKPCGLICRIKEEALTLDQTSSLFRTII